MSSPLQVHTNIFLLIKTFGLQNCHIYQNVHEHVCRFLMEQKPKCSEMLPIQENYEGRIDGHSNSNSKLLGWGLNIHRSFVSRSSQEKSKI